MGTLRTEIHKRICPRGVFVLFDFVKRAKRLTPTPPVRLLANATGYHCVWQSHQFSAFQGGALERGAGDLQSVAADVVFADEADQIVGEVSANVFIPCTNDKLSSLPW